MALIINVLIVLLIAKIVLMESLALSVSLELFFIQIIRAMTSVFPKENVGCLLISLSPLEFSLRPVFVEIVITNVPTAKGHLVSVLNAMLASFLTFQTGNA